MQLKGRIVFHSLRNRFMVLTVASRVKKVLLVLPLAGGSKNEHARAMLYQNINYFYLLQNQVIIFDGMLNNSVI